jgi:hypothetical protein
MAEYATFSVTIGSSIRRSDHSRASNGTPAGNSVKVVGQTSGARLADD